MSRNETTSAELRASRWLCTATAALLIAQQVAAKAARDALFLTYHDVRRLPGAMIVSALLGMLSAVWVGRLLTRLGPARCVPGLFVVHGLLFVVEHAAAAAAPGLVSVVLYLHVASLGAVVVSVFWSMVNERFDPYTARRVIGQIGAGATVGGMIGGLGTGRLAQSVPAETLLLVLAGINLVAAVCALGLGHAQGGRPAPEPAASRSATAGLRLLRRTPYLRDLAALVGLLSLADALIDYVFKAEASRLLGQGEALLSFFALFYTGIAVLTFLVQTGLTAAVLRRQGLSGAVAALPGSLAVSGALSLALPGLAAVGLLRGATSVIESSLFRSGYELLYTPLPARDKRAAKAVVDVAVARLAAMLGGAAVAGLLWFASAATVPVLLASSVVLGALSLWVSSRLHRGYVEQLADSLRAGAIELDSESVVDRVTLQTLTRTVSGLDRSALDRAITAARARGEAHWEGTRGALEQAQDFLSGERERARAAFGHPLSPSVMPFALPWLADDALQPTALAALSPLARTHPGAAIDALLDPATPARIRRRLPALLQRAGGERAQRGLFHALADREATVRMRAARALAAIATRAEEPIVLERDALFDAIRRELARVEEPADAGPSQAVELVFALLSLCVEADAPRLALAAVRGGDPNLRGTALEYLDNILPTDVRKSLWPHLRASQPAPPQGQRRSHAAILDTLRAAQHRLSTPQDNDLG